MAKSVIEKVPIFKELASKELFDLDYIGRYKEVDSKGKYLYINLSGE